MNKITDSLCSIRLHWEIFHVFYIKFLDKFPFEQKVIMPKSTIQFQWATKSNTSHHHQEYLNQLAHLNHNQHMTEKVYFQKSNKYLLNLLTTFGFWWPVASVHIIIPKDIMITDIYLSIVYFLFKTITPIIKFAMREPWKIIFSPFLHNTTENNTYCSKDHMQWDRYIKSKCPVVHNTSCE